MTEQQINSPQQQGNDEMTGAVTLHDIIRMVIANWYWFVLSALVCLSLAYYYLASTPKIYSARRPPSSKRAAREATSS